MRARSSTPLPPPRSVRGGLGLGSKDVAVVRKQLVSFNVAFNVARAQILAATPYVGLVCCWFSLLLREVFLQVLQFFALLKKQLFQIPILPGTHGRMSSNEYSNNYKVKGLFTWRWGPRIGEVICGGLPYLSCKSDKIKIRDHMDRRITPPKRVTSPTWVPPPPCKQAFSALRVNKLPQHILAVYYIIINY